MYSRRFGVLVALATTLPAIGQAAAFNYSSVDLALLPHAEIDVQNDDTDGDGFALRGSLEVNKTFFATVELQDLDLDDTIDVTRWILAGGGHWPINNTMDIVARAGIVNMEADAGRFDEDDTGLFFGARVRALVAPKVEVEGGIEYMGAEVFEAGDDVYLVGEGRYYLNSQLSVGGFVNLGGDVQLLGIYGRYSF